MIVLGLILLIIGLVANIPVLTDDRRDPAHRWTDPELVPIGGSRRRVF